MYVRRPLYAPNILGRTIGAGSALLVYQMDKKMPLVQEGDALQVYQQGQDISVGPVEGNCGRTVGVIPDSHPSTLGAALSFQIQTTIIPGEKMVVIHPGRHS